MKQFLVALPIAVLFVWPGDLRADEDVQIVTKYKGRIATEPFPLPDKDTKSVPFQKETVITNQAQYDAFVARLPKMEPLNTKGDDHSNDDPLLKKPPVDFTQNMVLAVTRDNMYLAPDITHVAASNGLLVVHYTEEELGEVANYQQEGGLGTYCAVVVPKTTRKIVFRGTTRSSQCGDGARPAKPIPAPRLKTSGTSLPTVRVVAYEGISIPGPDGNSGYRLSPDSHQLVLNAHFGEARTVHTNDADYIVVQLLPSFQPAAQAFVKASPKNIVTYVKEIDGYHPKYLDRISDPTKLREVSIPIVKKETSTRVAVVDSTSEALKSSFVFKAGKTVSIRLRYAGNAKNWDAGFEMQKESLVTSNSATIILTDSKGKSVSPRKDKILNLQYDQIMARPFDVTIDLVKLYDISQVGAYKLEWGCKQVQTQVVDFEIKE